MPPHDAELVALLQLYCPTCGSALYQEMRPTPPKFDTTVICGVCDKSWAVEPLRVPAFTLANKLE